MRISFETIRFAPSPQGVVGLLYRYFRFELFSDELSRIGEYAVVDGGIEFVAHEKKRSLFMGMLSEALTHRLVCTITNRPSTYIDASSGVPLYGALEFGIIDRGTNVLEIRPMSGCNLACTYCSVSEGPNGPKIRDLIIQREYFVSEFAKIAAVKKKPLEVYIETQGEPLLYWELPELIADLKRLYPVTRVTMVTNGTLLTRERVHALKEAGLDRINWSINSLRSDRAEEIAGMRYDVEQIKKMILYAKEHIDVLMCPVIMRGVNDDEFEDFIRFGLEVRSEQPVVAFQNFLYYKGGRNPVKEVSWDGFSDRIKELEAAFTTRLLLGPEDFSIEYDETFEKPFKKRDVVEVEYLFKGRLRNEAFCTAAGRIVKVIGRYPDKKRFSVRIIRDKHNVFLATTL